MAGALDGTAVEAKQYSHEDVTGVGYGICSFVPKGDDDSRRFLKARLNIVEDEIARKKEESDAYVRLARVRRVFCKKRKRNAFA